jgi:hypothetical protein
MAVENCRECRNYFDNNSILGLCRRFPTYQNRSPQEWCGEFSSKAVAEVTPEPSGDFLPLAYTEVNKLKPKRMGRPKKSMIHENPFTGEVEVLDGN